MFSVCWTKWLTVFQMVRTFDLTIVNPTDPFKNYNAGVQIQWDMFFRVTLASEA